MVEEPLRIPFVSESYDRMLEARAKAKAVVPVNVSGIIQQPIADADALKAARATLSMTQAQMGEALGMDAPRLSGMENGKPIDARTDLAVRCLLALKAL